MHWEAGYFRERASQCAPVAELNCPKIAIVQDEFYNIDLVVEFLGGIGVTHVLTCSEETEWRKLYGKLDLQRVKLRTVLSGYVDETRMRKVPSIPLANRSVDLGYRAWKNPYWLGEHGMKKVRIAEVVGAAARRRGLRVDINNPAALDFLIGKRWYEFLSRCRAVLGVEGGASVLDRDGTVRQRVEAYLRHHPDATFDETRQHCFPERDHELKLACLSPRHLEACVTRTCQVLLEGNYNGVLRPWEHYIPVKHDFSNVDEVLNALQDDDLVQRLVNQAYEETVASGKWSYRTFVREIERTIIDTVPTQRSFGPAAWVVNVLLLALAALAWRFAHWEARGSALLRRVIHLGSSIARRCRSLVQRMASASRVTGVEKDPSRRA